MIDVFKLNCLGVELEVGEDLKRKCVCQGSKVEMWEAKLTGNSGLSPR